MTDSIIERAVIAAWDDLDRQEDARDLNYVDRDMDLIDGTVDMPSLIRAVIVAMRDFPDQLGNSLPEGYKPGSHSAREIWNSVIDGALAEGDR